MNQYEALEQEARDYGIDVNIEEDIPVPGIRAAYIRTAARESIVLVHGSQSEQTCHLAEELGHHSTGFDRVLSYRSIDDWKAEARARKWAHDRLLSVDAIKTAAINASDIYDLADSLGVTKDFLIEAIDDYMNRGLWGKAPAPDFCK